MGQKTNTIDKEYILNRISDWKYRLNQLYENVESWSRDCAVSDIIKKELPLAKEELMQKFCIEPDNITALAIKSGESRTSFVPMGLWVVGSNGRVNIRTNTHQYILVDLGDNEDFTSDWTVVNPSKRGQKIHFDKAVMSKLLKDEDLFA